SRIAGAYIDVRQLENGKPVPNPVEVRFSGDDLPTLRALAARTVQVLRQVPIAARVRDDFGVSSLRVELDVDPVRAALTNVTNSDVAQAGFVGLSGSPLGTLRDRDKRIPIVARLRVAERGNLGELDDLYVFAARSPQKVPVRQVATKRWSFVP